MRVHYMNGAGNDFMVIDARGQKIEFAPLAVELCKLTGADGFMAIDHSDCADFRLHFYNSDGTRGEMCGNGARCICRYAYELGVAGENMVVQTDAGLVSGQRISENIYRVQLNLPSIIDLNRLPNAAYVELGDPGVPHSVTEVPGLCYEKKAAYYDLAKGLRHDPVFPKGVNANLYTWLDDTTVRVLTFERGVEDYTLACGTGSGSVAVTLWAKGQLPGGFLNVQNQGGMLAVTVSGSNGQVESLLLEGPAQLVEIYNI